MKKFLLFVTLIAGVISNATAQCTPDITDPAPNYADSTFGAWPDTVVNFGPAEVGVAYTQELQFKVPSDAGDIDPDYAGIPIDSFTVVAVNGMPAGLTYACNIASCTFNGGTVGCALISGTCSATGVYPVTIDVTAYLEIFGSTVPTDYTFEGYRIVVGTAGTIEAIINPINIHPNPANEKITLSGLNEQMKISSVSITNMEGKVMKNVTVTSSTMDVNLEGFESGVYFIVVNHAGGKETLKFIKE